MKEYDCIIVGGGPAGCAAAKIFNDNNINYCLIDKCKFPREKLCGGGLTNKSIRTLNNLGIKIDDLDRVKVNDILLVSKKISRKMPLDNSIVMVDRMDFDNHNLKQIVTKNLFENEKIISIEDNIITTDKNKFKYKYIIFADGINGFSRKLIKGRKFGFCVEYESDVLKDQTILDFTAIPYGYGWVFPKKKTTTIGLGGFADKQFDFVKSLTDFCLKHNIQIDKTKIRGYHIPLFSTSVYSETVQNNNTIIVGDAASLVNPISGEGIYYALLSGKNAALSIIECMKNNSDLKETYFKKNEGIENSLKKMTKYAKLLYSKNESLYIRIGLSSKKIIKRLNRAFG